MAEGMQLKMAQQIFAEGGVRNETKAASCAVHDPVKILKGFSL